MACMTFGLLILQETPLYWPFAAMHKTPQQYCIHSSCLNALSEERNPKYCVPVQSMGGSGRLVKSMSDSTLLVSIASQVCRDKWSCVVGQVAKRRNDLEEEYEERDQEMWWYTVTGQTGKRPSHNLSRETSWLDKTVGNYSLRQWGPAYWRGRGVQNTGKEALHRVILPLVVPKYKRGWFSEGERSCPLYRCLLIMRLPSGSRMLEFGRPSRSSHVCC